MEKPLQHNLLSISDYTDIQAKKAPGKLDLTPDVSLYSDIIEVG